MGQIRRDLPNDEYQAAVGANNPSATNVFATIADLTSADIPHAVASGTNTYTATIPGVTGYTDGDAYIIRFTNGSDDDSTLNINGLGAKTLTKKANVQITGGDIVSGQEMVLVYDGTNFQCIQSTPNQLFAYVTNADSVAILKGQPVYAFGASGNRMSVKLASNASDATSAQTVGLVFSSSIAAGQKGFVITQGVIDGLNTGMYSAGNQLYLGVAAGSLTNVKPYAPNHLVYIGIVERANAGNGQIYVKPQNGYELDELHDVDLITTPPTDGQVLTYDSITGLWKNESIYNQTVQEEGVSLPQRPTINITGAGVSASDDALNNKTVINVPGSIGATIYYLNETVTQAPYKEFSSISTSAVEQTIATTVGVGATATVQSFQTPSGVPNTTNIPAGLWQFYLHFSGTAGNSWSVFAEVYKRNLGGVETLLLTTDLVPTTTLSATPTMLLSDGVFPASTVLTTDRIVVKVRVRNTGVASQTITFHTEGTTNYSVSTTTLNQIIPVGGVTAVTGTAPITSSGGTTPAIGIPQATALVDGYLDSVDWTTFNGKQDPINLTTVGSSGAATFITNTLNIPNYTLAGLGGVPISRTITINGTTFDLSANRTWSVGTVTSVGLTAGTGISLGGTNPITSSGSITVTNSAPDQTVVLNNGTGINVTGTYPNFTITNTSTGASVTLGSAGGTESLVNDGTGPSLATKGLTAGSGVSLTGTASDITIANTDPGSAVTLTSAGGTETLVNDGTGPALATKGITAGTGISLSSTATALTVTNSAPDQTVVLNSGTGINVTGTYPNFTIDNTIPSVNLYNSDGTLTGDRTATFTGRRLLFTGVNSGVTVSLDLRASTGSGNRYARMTYAAGTTGNQLSLSGGGAALVATDSSTGEQSTVIANSTFAELQYTNGSFFAGITADPTGLRVNNAYFLPATAGSANQVLTTNGLGTASWQTPSTPANIYNSDGTLSGNRTVTMGSNTLTFDGTDSNLLYQPNSVGGDLRVEGSASGLPRVTTTIPANVPLGKPATGVQLGIRAWDDVSFPGYGAVGDAFIYVGNETNGLNIANPSGTGTADYIRLFAGLDASGTADIHIQGTGVTRGHVGIGTNTPSEKLDVIGKVKATGLQVTTSPTAGYVLTSDASGNATWQTVGAGGTGYSATLNFQTQVLATSASNTTYVIGGNANYAPNTLANDSPRYRVRTPIGGSIKSVQFSIYIQGTFAGSGNVTLRVVNVTQNTFANLTTTYTMSSGALQGGARNDHFVLASPLAVNEGDEIQIRLITPAWITAPTNIFHNGQVYITN